MAEEPAAILLLLEKLQEDIRNDREAGRNGRAALHARLDEVIDRLGALNTSIAISGQIEAQVRGELDELKEHVDARMAEIAPTLDEWKRIRALGIGIVGLLTIGGVSIGASIAWMGEGVVSLIRNWLRID